MSGLPTEAGSEASVCRRLDGAASSVLSRRAVWSAAAGFWLFVAAMSAAQIAWIGRTPGQRIDLRGAIAWQTAYFLAWIPVTIAVWWVTRGWLPERFGGWIRLLAAHVPVLAAVALAHPIIVTLLSFALSHQSISIWASLVRQVRELNALLLIYTTIAGTGAAMALYDRYQDRQVATARLQAELAAARLQALRGHLQPHFLFNSLHSIAGLARAGDTAGVVRLIAALSDLLRHVLDAGDRHASLEEELEIVQRYVEIQRARFADHINFTIDLAPTVLEYRVSVTSD